MSGRASSNIPPSLRKIWAENEARSAALSSAETLSSSTIKMADTSTARAIVSRDTLHNGGWKLEDVTVRKPGKGELLVEMVGSGICHTDVLVGDLPAGAAPIAFYPRVLGHEGSGYVREIGPGVTVAQVGDPVLLSYTFCDACTPCKSQRQSHCNDFTPLNFGDQHKAFSSEGSSSPDITGGFFGQSSFASLSIVNASSVVNAKGLVKDKRELQLFSPLGCGIQTGSGTLVNVAQATSDDIVVIMGLGGVGLSAIMGANVQSCKQIIGVDIIPSRLELAKSLGATHVLNGRELPDGKNLVEAIRNLTDGVGPSIVVDTTGVPALIEAGTEVTRNCGKYIQVGSPPFDFELKISMFQFMLSGKQYIGAIEGQAFPPEYVPKMIQWYREGRFPIDKFFELIPAEDFQKGLDGMHNGTMVKPILCWS